MRRREHPRDERAGDCLQPGLCGQMLKHVQRPRALEHRPGQRLDVGLTTTRPAAAPGRRRHRRSTGRTPAVNPGAGSAPTTAAAPPRPRARATQHPAESRAAGDADRIDVGRSSGKFSANRSAAARRSTRRRRRPPRRTRRQRPAAPRSHHGVITRQHAEHGGRVRDAPRQHPSATRKLCRASGPADTRPRAGFSPTRPQHAAGIRIEPPPSFPCAIGTMPAAPRRPHRRWSRRAAIERPRVRGRPEPPGSVVGRIPFSGMFVLPTITDPAARSRASRYASTGEDDLAHRSEPIVIGIPATARLSLIAIGTPANGRGSPGRTASATGAARSGSTNVNALTVRIESLDRLQRGHIDQLTGRELTGAQPKLPAARPSV